MKLGLTASIAMMLVLAAAAPSQAGFDLSIGGFTTNSSGGAFTVFATATGQDEAINAYTVRLNLTNTSAGELPVTFAEVSNSVAPGFVEQDLILNNTIAALNGGTFSNSIGFSAVVPGGSVTFTQGNAVAVGSYTFSTANGFSPGDFIDVGFVVGAFDTQFSRLAGGAAELNIVGGTSQPGNNPSVGTSTRVAAVPEPSMFGLLGLVGAGLGLRRKRPVAA